MINLTACDSLVSNLWNAGFVAQTALQCGLHCVGALLIVVYLLKDFEAFSRWLATWAAWSSNPLFINRETNPPSPVADARRENPAIVLKLCLRLL